MADVHALPDDHVLKPLEDRMLQMCEDMHPAVRVLGGNFVAALRVFAKEHPRLVDLGSQSRVLCHDERTTFLENIR